MINADNPTSTRELLIEGLLAAAAFLSVGTYLGLALSRSWDAYSANVVPAEMRLHQADEDVVLDAAELVSSYRIPVPLDVAGGAMLHAARNPGDAFVTEALAEIESASAVNPLPDEFRSDAKRVMFSHQLQRQFHQHLLNESYARFEEESPALGRLVSYTFILTKTLESRYTK